MPTLTSDGSALLLAILADPADDTVRLAFADEIEYDQPARAEFIRVQVKLSAVEREKAELFNSEADWSRCDSESGLSASWCPNCGDCVCPDREDRTDDPSCPLHSPNSNHCRIDYLDRQSEMLAERELAIWPCGGPEPWVDALAPHPDCYQCIDQESISQEARLYSPLLIYRRGFAAEVRCDMAAWEKHGRSVVRCHPVERVVLSDREPGNLNGSRYWAKSVRGDDFDSPSTLPAAIFAHLGTQPRSGGVVFYRGVEDEPAIAEASAAAIAWAKSAPVPSNS